MKLVFTDKTKTSFARYCRSFARAYECLADRIKIARLKHQISKETYPYAKTAECISSGKIKLKHIDNLLNADFNNADCLLHALRIAVREGFDVSQLMPTLLKLYTSSRYLSILTTEVLAFHYANKGEIDKLAEMAETGHENNFIHYVALDALAHAAAKGHDIRPAIPQLLWPFKAPVKQRSLNAMVSSLNAFHSAITNGSRIITTDELLSLAEVEVPEDAQSKRPVIHNLDVRNNFLFIFCEMILQGHMTAEQATYAAGTLLHQDHNASRLILLLDHLAHKEYAVLSETLQQPVRLGFGYRPFGNPKEIGNLLGAAMAKASEQGKTRYLAHISDFFKSAYFGMETEKNSTDYVRLITVFSTAVDAVKLQGLKPLASPKLL